MRFIVESALAVAPTPEIMALLPAESARGVELDEQGIREALYVAVDSSRAWQILQADSREALDTVLKSLPLYEYATHEITQLAE